MGLGVFLFRPILMPLVWAVIISSGFKPVHNFLERKLKNSTVSAFLTCVLIFLIFILPVWQLSAAFYSQSSRILQKAQELSLYIQENNIKNPSGNTGQKHDESIVRLYDSLIRIENGVNQKLETFNIDVDLAAFMKQLLNDVSRFIGVFPKMLKKISLFFVDLFFFFIILFLLFKNGREFSRYIFSVLPFEQDKIDMFIRKFREITQSSLLSSLVISVVQGTLGFIIYMILGIEGPVVWSVFTALASFIPLFGATAAWFLAVLVLLISGQMAKAIILFAYGTLIISTSDNIIRPYLIQNRTKIHPVLIFFSVISGLRTLGIIGIFLGPLILAFSITALEIYKERIELD